jgi:parvulin-like peptidyl-prolyl isomerase
LSNLTKGLILLLVILGIGIALFVWKNQVGGQPIGTFNSIEKEDIELLLADLGKSNPMALKRFAENPEMKKRQLDDLKQLLAFASQAQREGLANEEHIRQELQNIRSEVTAVNYDREINSDKGPMPPFGFIGEERVAAFWGTGEPVEAGFFDNLKQKIGLGKRDNEMAFQRFLDTKIRIMRDGNPQMKDREISEDERSQARDFFAKVQIYEQEFNQKSASGKLPADLARKINVQVKLQQAQFLARLYSDMAAEKIKVTDEDVDNYIAENPEYSMADKRAKAEEILARAKSGDDFASLANEFSEDPGNGNADGKKKGGLYEKVTKGRMVPEFEEAALAIEPGQIAPELVESNFGYHIIKLDRKGETKDAQGQETFSYDVRHILISTNFKDPDDPMGREMPVKQFVRQKLEAERQKAFLDDLVAKNNVRVPEDFDIPEVTEEQIEDALKEQQRQMGIPEGAEVDDGHGHGQPPAANPPPGKDESKK